ncbi:2-amino-4-hydroxy-6-hydroxymethyldihydropteridine diphosphokinase [Thalassovita sp.]|uniref:2-amino-4-hydroxy-6- hydroxymethyldihydropteridine diphosphokinase n=1 Tax=Thalassovita sp. TaxID=1979401 RepID=UPI002881249C|nr:2-amino-4-hydroxy-6-hydroxymethyldihydropteridine diphosphokinase [Thalassovita sp.]MDF1803801.1 2-amino-4-hydroxy-6-hydroxymethyldihydropteridine diphosphokinase [Thalassovita sp.]
MKIDQEIVLALGSNQTFENVAPAELLGMALESLALKGVIVLRQSRFFHTPCFPVGAGPDYVNAVVVVQTDLAPTDLLTVLHQVEAGLGRERNRRWAARTVDIDLVAYGQRVLPDVAGFELWHNLPPERQQQDAPKELILPHPRMHERAFVLVPMMDVAPDWHHPVLGQSVRQFCAALSEDAIKEVRPV